MADGDITLAQRCRRLGLALLRPPPAARLSPRAQRAAAWLGGLSLAYLGLLLLLLLLTAAGAYRWWPLFALLYLPLAGGLLPLLPLFLAALRLNRRLALLLALFALAYLWLAMGYRFAPPAPQPSLRLVSHNAGQNHGQDLREFLARERPDLILLQESGAVQARQLRQLYPAWQVEQRGQYIVASRLPLANVALLPDPPAGGRSVGLRCEVELTGRRLAVYNVHLHSPRDELLAARAALGNRARADSWTVLQRALERRCANAADLRRRLAAETLPVLAAGDFNMPDRGQLYREFAGQLTDSHARVGQGYGYTCPGSTSHRFSDWLAPWLRLDYVFTGAELVPLYCRVEPGSRSQHRALAAGLAWR